MNNLHIVKELTGNKRNRVFTSAPYLEILSEGTPAMAVAAPFLSRTAFARAEVARPHSSATVCQT